MAARKAPRARKSEPERANGPGRGGMPADPVATIRKAARVFRAWGAHDVVDAMGRAARKYVPGAVV